MEMLAWSVRILDNGRRMIIAAWADPGAETGRLFALNSLSTEERKKLVWAWAAYFPQNN